MSTAAAVAPPPGNPRFPLIDSLRAIAILCVFTLHSAVTFAPPNVWYSPYVARLDIGLTMFFVISGFLLYRPFVASRLQGIRHMSVLDYGRNRVLRVVPGYWTALVLLGIYPGLTGVFTNEGWRYFLFFQQYDSATTYNGLSQAWSLCVELSFYAALPLLALAAARLGRGARLRGSVRRELLFLGALWLLGLGFLVAVTGGAVPEFRGFQARYTVIPGSVVTTLPGVLGWFVLGMALAVASVAVRAIDPPPAPLRWIGEHPALMWLGAFVLWFGSIVLGLFPHFPDPFGGPQWLAAQAIYGFIVVLLMAPAIFADHQGGLVRGLLANRFLSWLGLISFGLFLWHTTILDELGHSHRLEDVPGLVLIAVAFSMTVACAAASYYLVERPFLRMKYGQKRKQPRPAPVGVGAPSTD